MSALHFDAFLTFNFPYKMVLKTDLLSYISTAGEVTKITLLKDVEVKNSM